MCHRLRHRSVREARYELHAFSDSCGAGSDGDLEKARRICQTFRPIPAPSCFHWPKLGAHTGVARRGTDSALLHRPCRPLFWKGVSKSKQRSVHSSDVPPITISCAKETIAECHPTVGWLHLGITRQSLPNIGLLQACGHALYPNSNILHTCLSWNSFCTSRPLLQGCAAPPRWWGSCYGQMVRQGERCQMVKRDVSCLDTIQNYIELYRYKMIQVSIWTIQLNAARLNAARFLRIYCIYYIESSTWGYNNFHSSVLWSLLYQRKTTESTCCTWRLVPAQGPFGWDERVPSEASWRGQTWPLTSGELGQIRQQVQVEHGGPAPLLWYSSLCKSSCRVRYAHTLISIPTQSDTCAGTPMLCYGRNPRNYFVGCSPTTRRLLKTSTCRPGSLQEGIIQFISVQLRLANIWGERYHGWLDIHCRNKNKLPNIYVFYFFIYSYLSIIFHWYLKMNTDWN